MATVGDVEGGLCQALAGFMFPGQVYQFGAVANCSAKWTQAPGAPVLSIPVRLAPGTPTSESLNIDIAAKNSTIAVSRQKGFSRNTTRFNPHREQTSSSVPTLTYALADGAVTFGGMGSPNQIVSVQAGQTLYAYLAQGSDTPASVAAALAGQIPTGQAVGAVLTADQISRVAIAAWQSGVFITGQQEILVTVTAYAVPTASAAGSQVREALGFCVNGLKNMVLPSGDITRFIGLADGTRARVLFHDEIDDDTPRRSDVWRRWTGFRVEYDEAIYENWPVMLAPLIVGNTGGSHILWFGPGAPAANVLTDGQGDILLDSTGAPLGQMASVGSGYMAPIVNSGPVLPAPQQDDPLVSIETVATTISGGMAVAQEASGFVPASADTMADAAAFFGVAQQGGVAGSVIQIVTYGVAAESGWSWTPDRPVFLGAAGAMTQTAPESGVLLLVGMALTATEIFVRPAAPIQL